MYVQLLAANHHFLLALHISSSEQICRSCLVVGAFLEMGVPQYVRVLQCPTKLILAVGVIFVRDYNTGKTG